MNVATENSVTPYMEVDPNSETFKYLKAIHTKALNPPNKPPGHVQRNMQSLNRRWGEFFPTGQLDPIPLSGKSSNEERLRLMRAIAERAKTIAIFDITDKNHKPEGKFYPATRDWQLMMHACIGDSLMVAWNKNGIWLGRMREFPGFRNRVRFVATGDENFLKVKKFATGEDPREGRGDPITVTDEGGLVMKGCSIQMIGVGANAKSFPKYNAARPLLTGNLLYREHYDIITDALELEESLGATIRPHFTYLRPKPPEEGEAIDYVQLSFEFSGDGHFRVLLKDARGPHKIIDEFLTPSDVSEP